MKEEKKERKYFEVFGDMVKSLSFFQTLTIVLAFLCVFLAINLRVALKKTPIVIRVDSLGNAQAFVNEKSLQKVTPYELSNFSQLFVEFFTAHNFYTYNDDFTKAFSMMTRDCQAKMNGRLQEYGIVDQIKEQKLKTRLVITEIKVAKDTPDTSILKVKGTRNITSYEDKTLLREEIFDIELVVKKVKRSMKTPWGLLIENFVEELYKK
jgi:hypothetical protein